jgi:hypothetical protein
MAKESESSQVKPSDVTEDVKFCSLKRPKLTEKGSKAINYLKCEDYIHDRKSLDHDVRGQDLGVQADIIKDDQGNKIGCVAWCPVRWCKHNTMYAEAKGKIK